MRAEIDREEVERVLGILNSEWRRELDADFRDLVIDRDALFQLIIAGRDAGLHPYVYDCHFAEYLPDTPSPADRDLVALAANGLVPFDRHARKAAHKVFRSLEDRRVFSAHLLYTPSLRHWHLFCFNPGSATREDGDTGRVSYSCASFARSPLREIWRRLCSGKAHPRSVHIRYQCS